MLRSNGKNTAGTGTKSKSGSSSRGTTASGQSREAKQLIDEALTGRLSGLQHSARELCSLSPSNTPTLLVAEKSLVGFLAMKQTLLVSYCRHLAMYLSMKLHGQSVASHPLMQKLLEMRTILEKIQPVDSKMRYQVDKLVRKAEAEPEYVDEQENPLSHRPNPGALVTKDQDPSATGGNDSDDNYPGGEIMGRGTSKARMGLAKLDVYHPPMMAAVPYSEDGDDGGEKQRRQQRRRRELLQRSEILETLQEEFGDAPLVTRSEARGAISDAAARKMREEDNLRHEFEENHMIRLQTTRKMKMERRARERSAARLDSIADIGNIGDLLHFGRSKGVDMDMRGSSFARSSSRADSGSKELNMALGAVGRKFKRQKKC